MLMNPSYSPKTILDWMNEMHGGSLALADFQRSLVWEDKLVSRYLKAILTDQPTGTLLMVKPGDDLKGRSSRSAATLLGRRELGHP